MKTLWVVCNKEKAIIYEYNSQDKSVTHQKTLTNSEARNQNQDIATSKPGRSFDSHGTGRHSYSKEIDPVTQGLKNYSREITAEIKKILSKSNDEITIVAESGLLGMLRPEIESASLICHEISKNIVNQPENDHKEFIIKNAGLK